MKSLLREVRDDGVSYSAKPETKKPVAVEISVKVKNAEDDEKQTASEGKAAGKQLLTEG